MAVVPFLTSHLCPWPALGGRTKAVLPMPAAGSFAASHLEPDTSTSSAPAPTHTYCHMLPSQRVLAMAV